MRCWFVLLLLGLSSFGQEGELLLGLAERVKTEIARGNLEGAGRLTRELQVEISKREKAEDYRRALVEVPSDDPHRLTELGRTANAAFEAGNYAPAEKFARDLLALAEENKKDENYGHAVYFGHMVLGRLALHQGNRQEAIDQLLASGRAKSSPVLRSFGPNMRLARDLLEVGERDAVVQFFEECRAFWMMHNKRLDVWIETVKSCCKMPEFGANLDYGVKGRK